jgi:hypothetical protein
VPPPALSLACAVVQVNVIGFLYWAGFYINSVTVVNIILTVGLTVDYSLHVAHAFLGATGTRHERALSALKRLGVSMAYGGVSVWLSVAALGLAQAIIFKTFFASISLAVRVVRVPAPPPCALLTALGVRVPRGNAEMLGLPFGCGVPSDSNVCAWLCAL